MPHLEKRPFSHVKVLSRPGLLGSVSLSGARLEGHREQPLDDRPTEPGARDEQDERREADERRCVERPLAHPFDARLVGEKSGELRRRLPPVAAQLEGRLLRQSDSFPDARELAALLLAKLLMDPPDGPHQREGGEQEGSSDDHEERPGSLHVER